MHSVCRVSVITEPMIFQCEASSPSAHFFVTHLSASYWVCVSLSVRARVFTARFPEQGLNAEFYESQACLLLLQAVAQGHLGSTDWTESLSHYFLDSQPQHSSASSSCSTFKWDPPTPVSPPSLPPSPSSSSPSAQPQESFCLPGAFQQVTSVVLILRVLPRRPQTFFSLTRLFVIPASSSSSSCTSFELRCTRCPTDVINKGGGVFGGPSSARPSNGELLLSSVIPIPSVATHTLTS